MLSHFLSEFNGFNRIQPGALSLLKERDYILHEGDINQIIGYIQVSSFSDVMLLINPESENAAYTKRILWMTWYALKLEKLMQGVTIESYETEIIQLKSMLFSEVDLNDLPDEDEIEEDDEDEEEEDFEDEDEDE